MPATLLNLDANALLWVQENLRFEALNPVMCFITRLGNAGIFWIIVAIVLIILPKTRRTGITAAVSMAIVYIVVNLILKNNVARIRPYEVVDGLVRLINAQKDFSFPSGHAANGFSVATVMFVKMKKRYGIPAILLALLISYTRIYVGVHYPTDVICGILLAVAIALITIRVSDRIYLKADSAHS